MDFTDDSVMIFHIFETCPALRQTVVFCCCCCCCLGFFFLKLSWPIDRSGRCCCLSMSHCDHAQPVTLCKKIGWVGGGGGEGVKQMIWAVGVPACLFVSL